MRTTLALVLALVAAGCIAPRQAAPSASLDPAGPLVEVEPSLPLVVLDGNATVDAPEWRVGDAWVVESGGVGDSERATLVVVSAGPSSYQLQSTSDQMATYDAMFDVSYLGRIRASDLAGHQQDQPVQFFSFPLSDGKAWTARWDGLDVSLTAAFAPSIPTPLGPQPGFVIRGTTDGQPYVEYDYVPALRWWSHLHFAEGYGIKVTGVATGWTGQYATASAKTLLTLSSTAPGVTTPAGAFTVDEGQSSVAVTMMGFSEAHARSVSLLDPEHSERMGPEASYGAAPAGGFDVRLFPAKAGQWKVVAPGLHHKGWLLILAQQVAVSKATL